MDFGRLLADPIMEDTVVKQLFFSSRRYGRFSLHSVRCDACAIRLNIAFFHVFWFPTDGIPIRQRALFGQEIGSPKREHSKTFPARPLGRRQLSQPSPTEPRQAGSSEAKPSRVDRHQPAGLIHPNTRSPASGGLYW